MSLETSQLTDDGLKTLLSFPGMKGRLKSLGIGDTKVTAAALDLVVQCKQLRSLSINSLTTINDDNVMQLARLPELRAIELCQTSVTRYRMRRLSTFPKLERIRTLASMAICDEPEEEREMEAFFADMREAELFVEVDYE